MAQKIKAGRRTIEISNADKLMFPEDGITKGDLIDYYARIADVMMPEVKGRLLTLERFPNGITGHRFFQKDMSDYFPEWLDRKTVPKRGGGRVTHVVASEKGTLVYLANQACITLHMTLSRKDRIDYPDQMIFDLDPSKDDFDAIRHYALEFRQELKGLGLYSVVKTSGSRGLHVTIPLDGKADYGTVRSFARILAEYMADRHPDDLTVEGRKDKRRGRIFVDWLRNSNGATVVAPFSVRARRGAPVALPVSWSEVENGLSSSDAFSMKQVVESLAVRDDPWKGWRRRARSLSGPTRRLERLIS